MSTYHKHESDKTVRHVWDFSEEETIAILKNVLTSQGCTVPDGRTFLSWERQSQFERTQTLSLFVDEKPSI